MKSLLFFLSSAAVCLAQGPLAPPAGPPATSMKTLDQIEPRAAIPKGPVTPVAGPHFTISQPGSYYLTGNITVSSGHGININADDVTLDLNGFTISSTAATAEGNAINLNGFRSRIAISNGNIRGGVTYSGGGVFTNGPGFASGIDCSSDPVAVRVSGVSVTGMKDKGIYLGGSDSCIVEACTLRFIAGSGIRAGVVTDSSVTFCPGSTIEAARVFNSVGSRSVTAGTGIVTSGATLESIADKRTQIPGGTSAYIISQPGSYLLAGNIEVASGNGITINASNVTLDLNGFALISQTVSPAAGNAIQIASNLRSIEIKNGRITGGAVRTPGAKVWLGTYANQGWNTGILDDMAAPSRGVSLSNLTVEQCKGKGIDLDEDVIMEHITVTSNGSTGIEVSYGSLTNITATKNGGDGISNTLGSTINATSSNNQVAGIYSFRGSLSNVVSRFNGGIGISADDGSVSNASVSLNNGFGISAPGASVTDSRATDNGRAGIYVLDGIAAHCAASGNSTDPTTTDKEIDVAAGGQRDACVPAAE